MKSRMQCLKHDAGIMFILSLISMISFMSLHPRIAITDIDAISYIEGAYALGGSGSYNWPSGHPLNVFPPGFSFLLSFFPNPIQAAYIINGISFGVAVALLYGLAMRSGWTRLASVGFALAFSFGFLRSIAMFAKPDILAYALFFLAIIAYSHHNHRFHLGSYFLFSFLIPLKHIALLFTPAAILATLLIPRRSHRLSFFWVFIISLGWLICLAGLVLFNYITIGAPLSPSHVQADLRERLLEFVTSPFRQFLTNWYGSIRDFEVLIPFSMVLLLGLVAVMTLYQNPSKRHLFVMGGILVFFALTLLLVRNFSMTPRLLGYGYLLLLVGMRPRVRWNQIWITYGVTTILLAIYNVDNVDSFGINDRRYEQFAEQVAAMPFPDGEVLYTNSEDILDIHLRVPTLQTLDLAEVPEEAYFLWVALPNYDAIMKPIEQMERPTDLCLISEISNAALFQRCE